MGAGSEIAIAWAVASRLGYVVGVGAMLRRQERDQAFTHTRGVDAGFAHFRRIASLLMNNDAVAFILLGIVTRGSIAGPRPILLATAGVLLCMLGIGIKAWAASALGSDGYYWRNFFDDAPHVALIKPGPYRFFKNPMYTLGNLHLYGFALLCASLPGLGVALFDHVALMFFHLIVEKPHFARVQARGL